MSSVRLYGSSFALAVLAGICVVFGFFSPAVSSMKTGGFALPRSSRVLRCGQRGSLLSLWPVAMATLSLPSSTFVRRRLGRNNYFSWPSPRARHRFSCLQNVLLYKTSPPQAASRFFVLGLFLSELVRPGGGLSFSLCESLSPPLFMITYFVTYHVMW